MQKDGKQVFVNLNTNPSAVSVIIEKEEKNSYEILLQIRSKPDKDPFYSGTIEIPGGGIGAYENVFTAAQREVHEETGLEIINFFPNIKTQVFSPRDDDCFAFVPFCCQQQLKGGMPRLGIVFIGTVKAGSPVPAENEVNNIFWIKIDELEKKLDREPEKFFTFQLPVLHYYLRWNKENRKI